MVALDYLPHIRKLAEHRYTIAEIADRVALPYGRVWQICRELDIDVPKRHNNDWLRQDLVALRYLWSEGFTASKIAIRLGRTRNAIMGKVRRLGLERRK